MKYSLCCGALFVGLRAVALRTEEEPDIAICPCCLDWCEVVSKKPEEGINEILNPQTD